MSTKDDFDDGLTEEERAALSDDGDVAVTPEASAAPDEDTAHDPEQQAEAAAVEPEPAAEPAAAEQPAEEVTQAQQQPAPVLVAPAPEDAENKLKEIADQKEALLNQFDEGDITAREYQKQLDELARQERAIERAQDRAELATQMEQQRQQNEWVATCNAFIEANSVYKDNPRLYKALDAEVRELAQKPETANWTGQKFLEEAHKALAEAFNLPTNGKQAKPAAAQRDLPPNLAKVPAADVQDTSGNRFAVLDRMASSDPIAYEEALSKMSPAERDAYLAA